MLTQNELNWLTERDKEFFFSCRYCPGRDKQTEESLHECMSFCFDNKILSPCGATTPEFHSLQDAAEFEAKVAARLAEFFSARTEIAPVCPGCPGEDDCYSGYFKCEGAILKYARLEVEEEIDVESKRA